MDEYLKECVEINTLVMEEEYVRLPGDLAYWNERYSEAYLGWLKSKITREVTLAELTAFWRNKLEAKKGSKVTVSEVESAVVMDKDYVDAKIAEAAAEADKVRLHGVMDAIRSKREMLISLGAHIRQEQENDPLIRKQRYVDRETRNNPTRNENEDV